MARTRDLRPLGDENKNLITNVYNPETLKDERAPINRLNNVVNWVAKTYDYDLNVVVVDGKMYELVALKPYKSTNFNNELAAGDWKYVGETNGMEVESVNSDFTIENNTIYFISTSTAVVNATLPDATTELFQCRLIKITDVDTARVDVSTVGGQSIGGATTQSIYGLDEGFWPISDTDNYIVSQDNRGGIQKRLSQSSGGIDPDGFITTVNVDNTVDITDGLYVIEDCTILKAPTSKILRFAGVTSLVIDNINTTGITDIFINANGTITQLTNQKPPESFYRTNVRIASAIHTLGDGTLDGAFRWLMPAQNPGARLSTFMNFLGVAKEGIALNGVSGTMQLQHDSGLMAVAGIMTATDPTEPDITNVSELNPVPSISYYTRASRSGDSGLYDSQNYNPTDDTVSAIPQGGNNVAIHRVYKSISGAVMVQYGQNYYTSLILGIEAFLNGSDSFEENAIFKSAKTVRIGYIIAEFTATDLTNLSDVKIFQTNILGDASLGSASAQIVDQQKAYDNGAGILINDAQTAIEEQDAQSGSDEHYLRSWRDKLGEYISAVSSEALYVAKELRFWSSDSDFEVYASIKKAISGALDIVGNSGLNLNSPTVILPQYSDYAGYNLELGSGGQMIPVEKQVSYPPESDANATEVIVVSGVPTDLGVLITLTNPFEHPTIEWNVDLQNETNQEGTAVLELFVDGITTGGGKTYPFGKGDFASLYGSVGSDIDFTIGQELTLVITTTFDATADNITMTVRDSQGGFTLTEGYGNSIVANEISSHPFNVNNLTSKYINTDVNGVNAGEFHFNNLAINVATTLDISSTINVAGVSVISNTFNYLSVGSLIKFKNSEAASNTTTEVFYAEYEITSKASIANGFRLGVTYKGGNVTNSALFDGKYVGIELVSVGGSGDTSSVEKDPFTETIAINNLLQYSPNYNQTGVLNIIKGTSSFIGGTYEVGINSNGQAINLDSNFEYKYNLYTPLTGKVRFIFELMSDGNIAVEWWEVSTSVEGLLAPTIDTVTQSVYDAEITFTSNNTDPLESSNTLEVSDASDFSTIKETRFLPIGSGVVSIGALLPNTLYYFRMKAIGSGGSESDYSTTESVTTSTEPLLSAQIQGLVTNIQDMWIADEDIVSGDGVNVDSVSSSGSLATSLVTTTTKPTINNDADGSGRKTIVIDSDAQKLDVGAAYPISGTKKYFYAVVMYKSSANAQAWWNGNYWVIDKQSGADYYGGGYFNGALSRNIDSRLNNLDIVMIADDGTQNGSANGSMGDFQRYGSYIDYLSNVQSYVGDDGNIEIGAVLIGSSQLTNMTQITSIYNKLSNYYGLTDRTDHKYIMYLGDSMFQGIGTTGNGAASAAITITDDLRSTYAAEQFQYSGVYQSGYSLENDLNSSDNRELIKNYMLSHNFGFGNKVAVLWAGTNDLVGGLTALEIFNIDKSLAYYLNTYFDHVILLTSLYRGGGNTAKYDEFNNYIKNEPWQTGISYVDVASDSRLIDFTDLTYFNADQIHLNNTGHTVINELVKPVIVNKLGI